MTPNSIKNNIEAKFISGCKTGNMEIVTIITSPGIMENEDYKLDYFSLSEGFRWACLYGHLPVVKYLLSAEFKYHVDIHTKNDSGFINACKAGQLEIVRYLVESPDLKEHVSIYTQNQQAIFWAIQKKQQNILEYFIFELKMPLTKNIENYIEDNIEDIFWANKIKKLFNTQIQYEHLHLKLVNKEDEYKLAKI